MVFFQPIDMRAPFSAINLSDNVTFTEKTIKNDEKSCSHMGTLGVNSPWSSSRAVHSWSHTPGPCTLRHGSQSSMEVQWKPFWLATQLYPQNVWAGLGSIFELWAGMAYSHTGPHCFHPIRCCRSCRSWQDRTEPPIEHAVNFKRLLVNSVACFKHTHTKKKNFILLAGEETKTKRFKKYEKRRG